MKICDKPAAGLYGPVWKLVELNGLKFHSRKINWLDFEFLSGNMAYAQRYVIPFWIFLIQRNILAQNGKF